MKCPNCGANIANETQLCPKCGVFVRFDGARSDSGLENNRKMLAAAGETSLTLGKKARMERLNADYSDSRFLSDRAYNAVIIGVLLYGITLNVILCMRVGDIYNYISPGAFLLLYLVCAIAGIILSAKSHNPAVSFLGYNLVAVPLGLAISTLVAMYGGIGSKVVTMAFVYTGLICIGMLGAAVAFPELFKKLGGALFGCLIGLFVCEILLLIFRVNQDITDWFAAGLFSLYIGYDVYRSQQFAKTVDNAVDCALDIYLDIANLFIRILSILSKKNRD